MQASLLRRGLHYGREGGRQDPTTSRRTDGVYATDKTVGTTLKWVWINTGLNHTTTYGLNSPTARRSDLGRAVYSPSTGRPTRLSPRAVVGAWRALDVDAPACRLLDIAPIDRADELRAICGVIALRMPGGADAKASTHKEDAFHETCPIIGTGPRRGDPILPMTIVL